MEEKAAAMEHRVFLYARSESVPRIYEVLVLDSNHHKKTYSPSM